MKHEAWISWTLEGDLPSGRYSRAYQARFDGGAVVPGAPSPEIVPAKYGDEAAVDPEEAFVAAISSCHMLWFLDFVRREGLTAHRYEDHATGRMTKNDAGQMWVSEVILTPRIDWAAPAPDADLVAALHDKAHHACFIANSVKTNIVIRQG